MCAQFALGLVRLRHRAQTWAVRCRLWASLETSQARARRQGENSRRSRRADAWRRERRRQPRPDCRHRVVYSRRLEIDSVAVVGVAAGMVVKMMTWPRSMRARPWVLLMISCSLSISRLSSHFLFLFFFLLLMSVVLTFSLFDAKKCEKIASIRQFESIENENLSPLF